MLSHTIRSSRLFIKRYINCKSPITPAALNNLPDAEITPGVISKTIDFLRENKAYSHVGINGLLYKPGPIHEIYCAIIDEDHFFINRVPSEHLESVFKEMHSDFFTGENLSRCELITGKTYQRFFFNVPLYQITNFDNKGWRGYEMMGGYGDENSVWRYVAPEITLVTDTTDFLLTYTKWKGPHYVQEVFVHNNAILQGHYHYIGVTGYYPLRPLGRRSLLKTTSE